MNITACILNHTVINGFTLHACCMLFYSNVNAMLPTTMCSYRRSYYYAEESDNVILCCLPQNLYRFIRLKIRMHYEKLNTLVICCASGSVLILAFVKSLSTLRMQCCLENNSSPVRNPFLHFDTSHHRYRHKMEH